MIVPILIIVTLCLLWTSLGAAIIGSFVFAYETLGKSSLFFYIPMSLCYICATIVMIVSAYKRAF